MGEVAEWPNAAAFFLAFFLKVVTPVSRRRGFKSLPSPLAGNASVNGPPFVSQSRCCVGIDPRLRAGGRKFFPRQNAGPLDP
jgi:hypothetical protein